MAGTVNRWLEALSYRSLLGWRASFNLFSHSDQRRRVRAAGTRCVGMSASIGIVKNRVVPCPTALSAQMRPPWLSTIARAMGRPEPGAHDVTAEARFHPEELLEQPVEMFRRDARHPDPPRSFRLHPDRATPRTTTSPPSGEYFTALSIRLRSTCVTRWGSASTIGKVGREIGDELVPRIEVARSPRARRVARRGSRTGCISRRRKPGIDHRRLEQVVDQVLQHVALFVDDLQELALRIRG